MSCNWKDRDLMILEDSFSAAETCVYGTSRRTSRYAVDKQSTALSTNTQFESSDKNDESYNLRVNEWDIWIFIDNNKYKNSTMKSYSSGEIGKPK